MTAREQRQRFLQTKLDLIRIERDWLNDDLDALAKELEELKVDEVVEAMPQGLVTMRIGD